MHRLHALCGHLVPSAVSGQQEGATHDSVDPTEQAGAPLQRTRVHMTSEDAKAGRQRILEYIDAGKRLKDEGEFPELTTWDLEVTQKHSINWFTRDQLRKRIETTKPNVLALLESLPGPWRSAKTMDEKVDVLVEKQRAEKQGYNIHLLSKWQEQHGGRGLNSNIAFPAIVRNGLHCYILVADPEDAERVSRDHLAKDGFFKPLLYNSVISTTNVQHWKAQRQHLTEALLPLSSLSKIFPVSLARAKGCAKRLGELSSKGSAVDMSDFLLHEAQAQLQLALLGVPESQMEQYNAGIRASFAGDMASEVGVVSRCVKDLAANITSDDSLALPGDGRQVKGPLAQALKQGGFTAMTDFGNYLIFLFAGHDTTGHTMTWLMMELGRNEQIQRELQREVDAFFAELGGRDPEYRDLARLDFMNRCITETLRMWPAVANGTFRRFHFEDTIKGSDGQPVTIPQGIAMMISNWPRHRNKELWGADVDEFNPYREFKEREVSMVGCPMAAMNPQSARFSPFAYSPRNCLGKNFAMMEARLIIAYLLRDFSFTLAAPYDGLKGKTLGSCPEEADFRGINRGTMGPKDLEKCTEHPWGLRHGYALKMHASRRGGAGQ